MKRILLRAAALFLLCNAGLAPSLQAQQPRQEQRLLPDTVAQRLVAFYNRESTLRMSGEARIGAGTALRGDVAVLGTLVVDGVVEGHVVVINGSLTVNPGARIAGSASVAGGDARIATEAEVSGGIYVYREPLRYRQQAGRIAYVPPLVEPGLGAGVDLSFGRTDIFIASHGPYNRVEGLPIGIGPRIRSAGSHPMTARAIVIARTSKASELEPRRIGYDLRAEQVVMPAAGLALGARLYSEIAGIEERGLSDREASLAAFLLHRDYRDYYEREGWSLYGTLRRPGTPWTLQLEYRDEEHASRAAVNPLTLLHNRTAWRPQPTVAEGAVRSITASLSVDTRNEDRDPSAGWQVDIDLEQGLGGTLRNPGMGAGTAQDHALFRSSADFLGLDVDIRRYARLTPYSRLALRIAAAGSVDGGAMPPQRQHALGGAGSLPGYRPMEFDCGARDQTLQLRGDSFHPYYGCDRMTLVQLEYQANFPLARRLAESAGIGGAVGSLVRWVVFFDAGRAWIERESLAGRARSHADFSADAGLGIRVGPFGAYLAFPLSGSADDVNFFVRLGPRL
jgi:hypothetical protein